MQRLVWQNSNGDEINLTSGNYGITNWEGFANTSLNIQSQQVPFQDGGVFLDALMEQRELAVTLAMYDGGNLETRYRMKRELIHILNPKLGEGYLIYTNDFISKRIKCVAQIPLFETHNSNDSGTPKASLAWTACDPYWEDVEETSFMIKKDTRVLVENNGDVNCGIVAKILGYGNIQNPFIVNTRTKQKIEINGTFNESISVNTNSGKKTVVKDKMTTDTCIYGNIYPQCYNKDHSKIIGASPSGVYIGTPNDSNIEWELVKASGYVKKIIYSEEKQIFIGVTQGRNILKSSNGIDWTVQTYDSSSYPFESICFSEEDSLFVIVGGNVQGNIILTSSDGENWFEQTTPTTNGLYDVIYIKDMQKYFAIGINSTIYTSVDGISWINLTNDIGNDLTHIKYINGLLFMLSGNAQQQINEYIVYSEDGENFEKVACHAVRDIIYNQNAYYIVGGGWYTGHAGYIKKSYDLITFETLVQLQDTHYFVNIMFITSYNYYYVIGDYVYIGSNDEFIKIGKVQTTSSLVTSLCLANNVYIFLDNNGYYVKFNNEDYFKYFSKPIGNYTIKYMCYSEKHHIYILVGTRGFLWLSEDCKNWESVNTGINNDINKIIYSERKDLFVGLCETGVITSQNGRNWDYIKKPDYLTSSYNDVVYNEYTDKFLLITWYDFIKTENFNDLEHSKLISNGRLMKIAFDKKMVAVIGRDDSYTTGFLFYSMDYNTWVSKTDSRYYSDIIHTEGFAGFLIACNDKTIIASNDCREWKTLFEVPISWKSLSYSLKDICIFGKSNSSSLGFKTYFSTMENIINHLSKDSDLDFKLQVGQNVITLTSSNENDFYAIIKYRQKYIGV